MRKISSEMTLFYKKIFPSLYFGFLTLFLIVVIFGTKKNESSSTILLTVAPVLMMLIGLTIFKESVFAVADEVFDCENYLLVRRNNDEVQVLLTDIQDIEYFFGRQMKVVILLRNKCELGQKISFYPAGFRKFGSSMNPTGNQIADELIKRIKAKAFPQ